MHFNFAISIAVLSNTLNGWFCSRLAQTNLHICYKSIARNTKFKQFDVPHKFKEQMNVYEDLKHLAMDSRDEEKMPLCVFNNRQVKDKIVLYIKKLRYVSL